MVRTSSVLLGAPQAEQKRPVAGTSVPQDEQGGMNFPDTVYPFSKQKHVCGFHAFTNVVKPRRVRSRS
jgi:hypothetical protein